MSSNETARAVLELLASGGRLDLRALRRKLPEGLQDLTGALEQLEGEGLVRRTGKGSYALVETLGMVRGELTARTDGSARIRLEDGGRAEIEGRLTGGAWHGDTVLVRILEPLADMKSYRGRVVEVLSRSRTGLSGVARRAGDRWVIDPVDPRLPRGVDLETGDEEVIPGTVVTGELDFRGKRPSARLRQALGKPDSPGVLIDSVCADLDLPGDFMEEVIEEAELAAARGTSTKNRLDLRTLFTVTVDPVDARDFDDAISVERLPGGGYRLGVHIADVAFYVPRGGMVDAEARFRGTSVYLPDRVIPMIPGVLSNGACSLLPDQERMTRTVFLDYDRSGRRTDYTVSPSVIRSKRRLNYEQALDLLNGDYRGDPELERFFEPVRELDRLLWKARSSRGALALGSSEFRTRFGDDGMPEGFDRVPEDRSHSMIENFMVEANRTMAEHCRWLELPALYRVHPDPDPGVLGNLRGFLSGFGVRLGGKAVPAPGDYNAMLTAARELPQWPLIREASLRALQKAVYSPLDHGHYGLALRHYTHFTSPIRRYPDLLLHQALAGYESREASLGDQDMKALAAAASALERRASQAEWDSTELMALLFLSGRRGCVYRGMISDVKDFGVFVRLQDVPIEGLIPGPVLRRAPVRLHGGGLPGMQVSVAVLEADPLQRRLALTPVPDRSG